MRYASAVRPTGLSAVLLYEAKLAHGCLISDRTPSLKRAVIRVDGRTVQVIRVVMADHLDREILPTEDVHHWCGIRRCINPYHMQVLSTAGHRALHVCMNTRSACQKHGMSYVRRTPRGDGVCEECRSEERNRRREARKDPAKRAELTEAFRNWTEKNREHRTKYNREYQREYQRARRARLRAQKNPVSP